MTVQQADSVVSEAARQGIRLTGAWFQDKTLFVSNGVGVYQPLLAAQIQNPDSVKLTRFGFSIPQTRSGMTVPFGQSVTNNYSWLLGFCEEAYSRRYRNILVMSVQRGENSLSVPLAISTENPFTTRTQVRYRLEQPGNVELAVYNTQGVRLTTVARTVHKAQATTPRHGTAQTPKGRMFLQAHTLLWCL